MQFRRPVSLKMPVNQQWKPDTRLNAKLLRVAHIAQPDRCQPRSFFQKCLFVIAQLRNVLAAENSTVGAKEYDYRRPLVPKRAQSHRPFFRVRQDNLRHPRAQSSRLVAGRYPRCPTTRRADPESAQVPLARSRLRRRYADSSIRCSRESFIEHNSSHDQTEDDRCGQ